MQDILGTSLRSIRWIRTRNTRLVALLLVLSLIVSLDVFWILRQPGLTLAGNADCQIVEHTHDASCADGAACTATEHVHTIHCYSDNAADVETQLDWQKTFADYPFSGDLRKDLVGIAQTQVGYSESKHNFQVGNDGVRRGYTRYGAWYGSPYSNWSALFVSFCLHYAGADHKEYPTNLGANSMAELWRTLGRYMPNGRYQPVSGDLVFFKDNTVGIIVEVYKATLYVIRGDMEDAVQGGILSLADSSIAGWGITGPRANGETTPEDAISPTLTIWEGSILPRQSQPFMLRFTRKATDLVPYLEANGGSYFFTLLDKNNQELPKDDSGNYVVQADTAYKLTVSFTAPEGFLPGTYQYQVPYGLLVDGGEGTFILKDGTEVGSWVVTDDGLITLVFNENMNSRTDITISATLGIHFPVQDEPIDFDGKISVTIQKPTQDETPTEVTKWGIQGSPDNASKPDPKRIYWNVSITGNAGSNIPGSVLTDRIVTGDWIGDQHYTQQDMSEGLRMGASDPNWNWHGWTVYPGDPNLTWTEDGWSYTMPETITCWCGEVTLGNEGWIYYIDYSSTPDLTTTAGTLYYMNRFTVDGQFADGGASFTQGEVLGEVAKTGSFISDAGGGAFLWEFQALIPGRVPGEKSEYHWYLMDYMYLLDANGWSQGPAENDAHLCTVTAYHNGTSFQVPKIQDATEDDLFAWDHAWTAVNNGVNYGREFNLLVRCQCNAENCQFWNGDCQEYWFQQEDGTWTTNGFCQCWTPTENTIFTFVYETQDLSVVEAYGSLNYQLHNVVELYYKPGGSTLGTLVSNAQASVPIPALFDKALTEDFDGYNAHYRVTINEAKLVLTDGSPLKIRDMMTDTLAFISGSLVITTEDAQGNISTLRQDVDYTIVYDGTGNQTDQNGKEVHVLDILVLHPQPVTYILDYDATLIMPDQVTGGIKYGNSATITLWGEDIRQNSAEKIYADINIAAKSYKVTMFKTCSTTGAPLGGAKFGLYNAQGGLITTAVSDANGELAFNTNIIEGIILREHVLYYMQELKAPPGYQLDDTQYWFCFCDEGKLSCDICDAILAASDGLRIPFEQAGKVHISNDMLSYDLPATGGTGTYPLILVSVIFIITPLVYGFILRRKRERRGVG